MCYSVTDAFRSVAKEINKSTSACAYTQLPKPKLIKQPFSFKSIKRILKPKKSKDTGFQSLFLSWDPEELARQLTLKEYKLFASMDTREFLDLNWMKEEKEELAPTIMNFTRWSNHVSFWVMSEVLNAKNIKARAAVMENCILLASVMVLFLK